MRKFQDLALKIFFIFNFFTHDDTKCDIKRGCDWMSERADLEIKFGHKF